MNAAQPASRTSAILTSDVTQTNPKDFIALLPAEVALRVLAHLDLRSLSRSTQVSRKWHQLADDRQLPLNKSVRLLLTCLRRPPIDLSLNFTTVTPRDLDLWYGPNHLLVTSENSMHHYRSTGSRYEWKKTVVDKGVQVFDDHNLLQIQSKGVVVSLGKKKEFILGSEKLVITGAMLPNKRYVTLNVENVVEIWDLESPDKALTSHKLTLPKLNPGHTQFAFGHFLLSHKSEGQEIPDFLTWYLFNIHTNQLTPLEHSTQNKFYLYDGRLFKEGDHTITCQNFSENGLGETQWIWDSGQTSPQIKLVNVQVNRDWVVVCEHNLNLATSRCCILDKNGHLLHSIIYGSQGFISDSLETVQPESDQMDFTLAQNLIAEEDSSDEEIETDMNLFQEVAPTIKLDKGFVFLTSDNRIHTLHVPTRTLMPNLNIPNGWIAKEVSWIPKNEFHDATLTVLASRSLGRSGQTIHNVFSYMLPSPPKEKKDSSSKKGQR